MKWNLRRNSFYLLNISKEQELYGFRCFIYFQVLYAPRAFLRL